MKKEKEKRFKFTPTAIIIKINQRGKRPSLICNGVNNKGKNCTTLIFWANIISNLQA
jgi:hypothetical protein